METRVGNIKETFKYSDDFRDIIYSLSHLMDINDEAANDLILKEDKNSNNIIDIISDSNKYLKLVMDNHVQKIRIGRTIQKITDKINNSNIENYSNKIRSLLFDTRFEIVEGNDILKYYNSDSYYDRKKCEIGNSLYESCMTDKPDNFFEIYTQNKNVRLLILIDNDTNKLLGRSLIWKANVNGELVEVMEKHYLSFQFLKNKFNQYSTSNNIVDYSQIENGYVELEKSIFEHYPYIDTFDTLVDNKLCIVKGEDYIDGNMYTILNHTNGGIDKYKGEAYYLNPDSDEHKYTFNYDKLKSCNIDDRYYLKEDTVTINLYNRSYIRNKSFTVNKKYKNLFDININIDEFKINCPKTRILVMQLYKIKWENISILNTEDPSLICDSTEELFNICKNFDNLYEKWEWLNNQNLIVSDKFIIIPVKVINRNKYAAMRISLTTSGIKVSIINDKMEPLFTVRSSIKDFINTKSSELKQFLKLKL